MLLSPIIQKAGHSPASVFGSLMLASVFLSLKFIFPWELTLPETIFPFRCSAVRISTVLSPSFPTVTCAGS